MAHLKDRLMACRGEMSQESLAGAAKVSQALIAALETGRQQSSGLLPEIAYALGVQAMWLKTGLGPKLIYPGDKDIEGRFLPLPNGAGQTTTLKLQESSPLESELASHIASMSERGLIVLIEEAQKIAARYPKAQPKVA